MKKLLTYLFLALIIVACSDDSEGLLYNEFDDNYNYSWTFNFGDNDIICLNVSCSDCSYIIYGGCD